jgi:hypothetical protein
MAQANRNHKDSVFVRLFSEKSALLELYNALSGENYAPDTEIEIATLDDVLFMDRINDLAFLIHHRLIVLVEHQSTINENIPLRFLQYVAREYEKIIDPLSVYKSRLIKIPKPVFIVLYNGTADLPDEVILRLSDAFEDVEGIEDNALELTVRIVNIRKGKNEKIVQRSQMLSGYVEFIDRIRENCRVRKMKLNDAMTEAVKYCIRADILTDFMKTNGSEVVNMLLTEFNIDDAKMVWREEAREEGREQGIAEGEARAEARERTKAQRDVLRVLELRFKSVPAGIRKSVESYTDLIALDSLLQTAVECQSVKEFNEALVR